MWGSVWGGCVGSECVCVCGAVSVCVGGAVSVCVCGAVSGVCVWGSKCVLGRTVSMPVL